MFFKRKNKDKTSMKDISLLHGKRLSYVVERKNGEEFVLGKIGGISVSDSEIIIVCDGSEVFRCAAKGAVAAQLMSNNGVDIKGIDLATGENRHVIAYYSSLRQ